MSYITSVAEAPRDRFPAGSTPMKETTYMLPSCREGATGAITLSCTPIVNSLVGKVIICGEERSISPATCVQMTVPSDKFSVRV